MVRHDPALFHAEDPVLLLFSYQDDFHGLQKILLGDCLAAVLNRENRALVDHVREIRTHRAGGRQSDGVQIDRLIQHDVLRMNLQDLNPALQIRALHDDSPVKSAGPQKRGIQHLGPVRCGQDQQTLGGVKAIHLGKQLIQGLLALVISPVMGITGLADGVNLIDENNTGGVLLRLLEQVAHAGRAGSCSAAVGVSPTISS